MSTIQSRRSQVRRKAAIFGVLSVALYTAVFLNSQTFLHYCARGGFYNVLPVATVFLFSYIHGSFASNVWTVLGIEASHKATKKATKATDTHVQQPARSRAVAAN